MPRSGIALVNTKKSGAQEEADSTSQIYSVPRYDTACHSGSPVTPRYEIMKPMVKQLKWEQFPPPTHLFFKDLYLDESRKRRNVKRRSTKFIT